MLRCMLRTSFRFQVPFPSSEPDVTRLGAYLYPDFVFYLRSSLDLEHGKADPFVRQNAERYRSLTETYSLWYMGYDPISYALRFSEGTPRRIFVYNQQPARIGKKLDHRHLILYSWPFDRTRVSNMAFEPKFFSISRTVWSSDLIWRSKIFRIHWISQQK